MSDIETKGRPGLGQRNGSAIFCCPECGHVEKYHLPSYMEMPKRHRHVEGDGYTFYEYVPVNDIAKKLYALPNAQGEPAATDKAKQEGTSK